MIIFLLIFVCIILHALVFIIFEVHHLLKTLMMKSFCDVFQAGLFCLFVRLALHFYCICLVILELGLCIERTMATVWSSGYEKFRATFGIFYSSFAVFTALIASYLVNYSSEDERNFSCLNNSKDRIRVDVMNYTLTALNFVTFAWIIILYEKNKCYSRKLDTHLSNRYQIQENVSSTKLTIIMGCTQLLLFAAHLGINIARRTQFATMDIILYRTLESVGYLFTYYSFMLPVVMSLFIKRERQTKIASLRDNINQSAKGSEGTDLYFGMYGKQW
ncbi:hypothetical protein Y032_0052g2249 [Ancylostoma ceylanicum]|uniref:Serpentine receptor class gamma n=1 Tax=Ancylostoma ceylanicum TaxID=53326 RepID=A0A016U762_9BILA|nr:hypothetical protein Y032_0052g2249 [Ancylostoma ceylanicum]